MTDQSLDRTKWHRPLCSIVVTHYNYSHLIRDALLSLLDQTYDNWECVVVDDCSSEDERRRLQTIIQGLSVPRIRIIQNNKQLGQIPTFFAGVAATSGEFVSPLDPDDRLDPSYLAEMVKAHLNESVFCSVVSCEEQLFSVEAALVTGTWKGRLTARERRGNAPMLLAKDGDWSLTFFPFKRRQWLWSSSSGIMVRRSALNLLVPKNTISYSALDAYLANGAHFLGGTLFYSRPLVYRGIHATNTYQPEKIVSMQQRSGRLGWQTRVPECKRAVVEAMFHNGVERWFTESFLAEMLRAQFDRGRNDIAPRDMPRSVPTLVRP